MQFHRQRDRHRQLTFFPTAAFATALAALATILLGSRVAVLGFAFAILPISGNTRVACIRDSFSTGISGTELSGMLIRSSGRGRKKRVGQVVESQHQVMCFVRGRQMARHVRLSAVRSRFVDGAAAALRSILMLDVLFVPSIRIVCVIPIVSASPGFMPAVLRRDTGTPSSVLGRRLVNFFFITVLIASRPSGFRRTSTANVASILRMAVIAGVVDRVSGNGACMRARTLTDGDAFTFTCLFTCMFAHECSSCFDCVFWDRFFHIFSLEFLSCCPVMTSGALADDISRGFMGTFPHRFSGVSSGLSTHVVRDVVSIEVFAGVFAGMLSSWHVGCSTSGVRRGRGTRRATLAFSFAFDMLSVRRSVLMLRPDPEEISIFLQSHSQFVRILRVRAHLLPILLCRLDHPELMPCRSLWDDGT